MKKIWFLFIASAALLLSCKKNFDANRYATPSDDALPGFLLYTGLDETATNNATNYLWLTRWMGYWARNGDSHPDEQVETYDIKNNFTDAEWAQIYHNLREYDELEKKATNLGFPFFIGAAKLMKAYCFSTLVDLYNDIPYYNAFNEIENGRHYDHAQDIYNDLIVQLDSSFMYFEDARAYYKNHSLEIQIADDQYDIMFGSARTRVSGYSERLTFWEKLVNTLELKLLIHQSQISAQRSFITEKINAINTSKQRKAAGFIGPGQSATINPGYGWAGKSNPFFALFLGKDSTIISTDNNNYYRANAYAYKFCDYGLDIRKAFLYDGNGGSLVTPCPFFCYDDSDYTVNGADTVFRYHLLHGPVVVVYHKDTIAANRIGSNYDGDPEALPFLLTDGVGGIHYGPLKTYNQDQFVFSDFESLFLQAEAVQYLGGNAESLYESAIRQNFIYLYQGPDNPTGDGALAEADAYLAQVIPNVGWSASPDKLEAILTQKWAAMNAVNWVEAYADYRRTGSPTSGVLGISHAPTHVQSMIPVRLLYPQSELDNNAVNVPQLGPGAQFTAKIFWDQ